MLQGKKVGEAFMLMQCPSIENLKSWLASGTVADSLDGFHRHVTQCATCQTHLDRLSDNPSLRVWADRLAASTVVDAKATTGVRGLPPDYYLPSRIGSYRIERELGRGGMGVVYLAYDEALERPVALKLIRRDALKPETRERFLREVRAAAKVQHDNVVGVYYTGIIDDGSPFLAMEYVPGPTLAQVIREQKRLPPSQAAEMALQIAAGLTAAHAVGLVHRDVKPANVLITDGQWSAGTIKLADFGMVHDDAESGLTTTGTITGTPAYLSPEQARGDTADARCDVYGLGVTLYEMMIGEVPYRGPPHQVLRQILDDEPRPPRQLDATIPRDLETIVLKALAKEPARRYQKIDDMAADLRRWLNHEPILARPLGRVERIWRWCQRNPKMATMTGLAAAALLALAVGGPTSAILIGRAYDRADQSRKQAEGDYELAVQSFITLVDGVQKQMGNQPGLLPLKKQLLETAADGLKKAIHDPNDTTLTDEIVFMAHSRLGEVLLDLGRSTEGKQEIETALRHGEWWVKRSPKDVKALRAVAGPSDRLGDIARYANQLDSAREWYGKATKYRLMIAELTPNDPQAKRDISISHGKWGDLEGEVDHWQSARTQFENSLQITKELESLDGRIRWLADMRYCRNRLSDACTEIGDLETADTEARLALDHAQELSQLDGNAGLNQRAFALDRLARVAARRFDTSRAIDLREQSLAVRREIAAADPSNVVATRYIGYALHFLGGTYAAAADFPKAREVFAEAIKVFANSVRDDPDSAQWTLNLTIAFDSAIENEEYDGQYAISAKLTEQLIEVCRRGEANPNLVSLKLESRRSSAERDLMAYRIAVEKGFDPGIDLSTTAAPVRQKLTRLRLWELVRQGKGQEAIAVIGSLDPENNPDDALIAARALARLEQPDKAVLAVRQAVRNKPQIGKDLHLMSEIVLLRHHPALAAFQAELFAQRRR